MSASRGSSWGPRPLPEFLTDQLIGSGYSIDDSGRIARQINEQTAGSGSASLFVDLGSCKFLEGDVDGAIAAWRHAISSSHDVAAARALLNLGLLYEHLHLHDRALGLLAAVADRNVEPYVVPAAMASARCQVARGDAELAMETMARLAQMTMTHHPDGPELIEALYGLGDVAAHAGRNDRAERSWRVAAASPSSVMQAAAADRLAQLLVDLGHDDELRDLLDKQHDVPGAAAVVAPAALVDRAEALCRLGDIERAKVLIEAVDGRDLSPNDRFRFAAAKVQCGQVNGAIDEFESLLGHDDVEVELRAAFTLGELYRQHDMNDAATTMFKRAIVADDRYWTPKASLAFGDLLDDAGDHAGAATQWRRAAVSDIRLVVEQAQSRLAESSHVVPASEPVAAPVAAAAAATIAAVSSPDGLPAEPQIISLDAMDEELAAQPAGEASIDRSAGTDRPDASQVAQSEPGPRPAEPADPAEPMIVVLSTLEDDAKPGPGHSTETDVIDLSDPPPETSPTVTRAAASKADNGASDKNDATPSAFASHVGDIEAPNPYASLAPDDPVPELPGTTRNPYAELAPNFGDDEFEPPADVEAGDWESMLNGWNHESQAKPDKSRSSAFSRYT